MAKKNTKEKIFDASIDLFSQYGYTGVSIRQIAKEVGIKESSIYNHYKSKESILESILTYYINETLKEEAPIMQSNDNLDIGFDQFYKEGSDRFISKLSEAKMMKITRIFLVGSYHNPKTREGYHLLYFHRLRRGGPGSPVRTQTVYGYRHPPFG